MWTIFHTEASLGWGGQEIRILNESIGMRNKGHKIVIITPPDSMLRKKASDQGFEVIALPFDRKYFPIILYKILNLIKQKKPHIINTHSSKDSWIASIAGRLSRYKPFIIRTRHLSTPVATNIMGSIVYRFLPHKIITTGEIIKEQLIKRNRVSADKVISLPTGIDFSIFNSDKKQRNIRKELSLPEKTPLIGMVSVLRSWKGHDHFIDAAELISKKNPLTKFLIVGDGPRQNDIYRIIKEKKLSEVIFMTGHRDDIPAIMASLDILVHPSYANEGVPQSLIQGMAMEVPIIASDLEALSEVIKDRKTGLVVPTKNPKKLAEMIMLLLEDSTLMSKLKNNAKKIVLEKFSIEKMIDSIESLYKSFNHAS